MKLDHDALQASGDELLIGLSQAATMLGYARSQYEARFVSSIRVRKAFDGRIAWIEEMIEAVAA